METAYARKMDLPVHAILDSQAKRVNVNSLLSNAKSAQIMELRSVRMEVLKNVIVILNQKTELYCGHFLEIAVKISRYTIAIKYQNITQLKSVKKLQNYRVLFNLTNLILNLHTLYSA